MLNIFFSLLKKDFKMLISSKFFLLVFGSLILYSSYIQLVYVNIDQAIYPVYLYDPDQHFSLVSKDVIKVKNKDELLQRSKNDYAIGIDATNQKTKLIMTSSNSKATDKIRSAYALSLLTNEESDVTQIGNYNKKQKNIREITCEFLFFELVAVGFLGVASTLFKEKHMGVIRVHGVIPMIKNMFIASKLTSFLLADILFSALLTIINLGGMDSLNALPAVLFQTIIMSLIMTLIGFICAVRLSDFKQFSLLYLVLAVFVTTPVFLAGQTEVTWEWINFHPLYHMFQSMKHAFFQVPAASGLYYFICLIVVLLLFKVARNVLANEIAKEG